MNYERAKTKNKKTLRTHIHIDMFVNFDLTKETLKSKNTQY